MISSIIQIFVGLLVWKLVPDWIDVKSRKSKNLVKIILNILGIVIILFGIVSFIKVLFSNIF
jgi:hypothetical protein